MVSKISVGMLRLSTFLFLSGLTHLIFSSLLSQRSLLNGSIDSKFCDMLTLLKNPIKILWFLNPYISCWWVICWNYLQVLGAHIPWLLAYGTSPTNPSSQRLFFDTWSSITFFFFFHLESIWLLQVGVFLRWRITFMCLWQGLNSLFIKKKTTHCLNNI